MYIMQVIYHIFFNVMFYDKYYPAALHKGQFTVLKTWLFIINYVKFINLCLINPAFLYVLQKTYPNYHTVLDSCYELLQRVSA